MNPRAEWLAADGLGGFASSCADGVRTRRYHADLLVATPAGRFALVNGHDAWIETASGRFAITSQRYAPDVTHPDGAGRIVAFEAEPHQIRSRSPSEYGSMRSRPGGLWNIGRGLGVANA